MKTVFFAGGGTGGHLYPALAIARELVKLDASIRPFFIGAERGIERKVLPTTELDYKLLDLHPLYRDKPLNNWKTITGGLYSWNVVSRLAREARPVGLVATGGYAAGVALGFAATKKIPIFIQEQNSHPGATVRAFARYAAQIHLGFPEARSKLNIGKSTEIYDSGNPIEPPPSLPVDKFQSVADWGIVPSGNQLVLISGGSQGSVAINSIVGQWIKDGWPKKTMVDVIWATGPNNFEQYKELDGDGVRVIPYISPMSRAYAAADIAIGRAGAMTVAELCAWGIPSILIPLPTAAADHQTINARSIQAAGAALTIPQSELTVERIGQSIWNLVHDPKRMQLMRKAALQRARPLAAQTIAEHILKAVS